MNKDVKQAMLNFLELFKKQGLARYSNGENVEQALEELIGVCNRLDAVNALTDEQMGFFPRWNTESQSPTNSYVGRSIDDRNLDRATRSDPITR